MAENTTDLDAMMQAAERLRRYIHAPSDVCPEKAFREVYGGGTSDDAALGRYQDDVADFLGAILPKGNRPVAALASEVPHDQRQHHWGHRWGKPYQANRLFWWGDEPLFASEDDCKTAMILDSLEKHQKLVSELEAPFAS